MERAWYSVVVIDARPSSEPERDPFGRRNYWLAISSEGDVFVPGVAYVAHIPNRPGDGLVGVELPTTFVPPDDWVLVRPEDFAVEFERIIGRAPARLEGP